MFHDIFEQISRTELNNTEGLKNLLHRTWATISATYCRSVLESRSFGHTINESDIPRVELKADDVRAAVYSNMNMWVGSEEKVLIEAWFDMTIGEQNKILVEAFPDGCIYGV